MATELSEITRRIPNAPTIIPGPPEFLFAYQRVILLEDAITMARNLNSTHLIGITSGTFDIFHLGHTRYLEALVAETYRRALLVGRMPLVLVGIDSDDLVRRNKGYKSQNRPVQTEIIRSEIVANLRGINYTFIFDNDLQLADLYPHLFQVSTGSDHKVDERPEVLLMRQRGTDIIPLEPKASSGNTELLARIHRENIY